MQSHPDNAPSFAGMRVTVMGLGRFGGGVAATRWLAQQGAKVTVSDTATSEQLSGSIDQISDCLANGSVRLALGGHDEHDFLDADLVIANPAVSRPWENRFLTLARSRNVPVSTEIRLLADAIPKGVTTIGVTGSAGKSTTSAMIAHALRAHCENAAQTVWFGGNIGGSLLDDTARMKSGDIVVLELSSAMLYWLPCSDLGSSTPLSNQSGWFTDIGVLTSIAPNHIDWHGSIDHYLESKSQIARATRSVIAWDSESVRRCLALQSNPSVQYITRHGDGLVPRDLLRVPGDHNRNNAALASIVVSTAIGIDSSTALQSLARFQGLPDRLERVCTGDDTIIAYNDSKSTTPEATVLAVRAVRQSHPRSNIHLIAGGYDKGVSLDAIVQLERLGEVSAIYPIGTTGTLLSQMTRTESCGTLERAVAQATARMNDGDVLVLSPGCASWDQFEDYRQRGRRFVECVTQSKDAIAHTMRRNEQETPL